MNDVIRHRYDINLSFRICLYFLAQLLCIISIHLQLIKVITTQFGRSNLRFYTPCQASK